MLEFFCSTPNFDGYALYTKSLATCGYLHKSLYALDEMELQCHYEIPHSLAQYVANEAACGRTETELTVKTFMSRFAEQNKPVRPFAHPCHCCEMSLSLPVSHVQTRATANDGLLSL